MSSVDMNDKWHEKEKTMGLFKITNQFLGFYTKLFIRMIISYIMKDVTMIW